MILYIMSLPSIVSTELVLLNIGNYVQGRAALEGAASLGYMFVLHKHTRRNKLSYCLCLCYNPYHTNRFCFGENVFCAYYMKFNPGISEYSKSERIIFNFRFQ